jgi:hypothetical protein
VGEAVALEVGDGEALAVGVAADVGATDSVTRGLSSAIGVGDSEARSATLAAGDSSSLSQSATATKNKTTATPIISAFMENPLMFCNRCIIQARALFSQQT